LVGDRAYTRANTRDKLSSAQSQIVGVIGNLEWQATVKVLQHSEYPERGNKKCVVQCGLSSRLRSILVGSSNSP